MTCYHCSNCHQPYPDIGLPYRCPLCGGVFALKEGLSFSAKDIEPALPGIWPYRHSFGLSANAPVVSLGEGRTPLIEAEALGRKLYFKLEYMNPSGSFKDRATAPLLGQLLARGVAEAVEDSSGNAGASFAAYAARAGIKARVFVPDYASGPKRLQIESYGAELVTLPGPRSAAAIAVQKAVEQGAFYASHAHLPFGLAGLATIAYELVEHLGQAPGTVIAPVGHGSLLLGISEGFQALKAAGIITASPRLIGVQARACAPLWAQANQDDAAIASITEGQTLAEGVRVRQPARADELLNAVSESGGTFLAVEEQEILPGRDALARLGFYVEPTSAIVWRALEQLAGESPEPLVVMLTGSGLKSFD